jgi:four helix bundle protein
MAPDPVFDHEKLDVYCLELDFVKWATKLMEDLENIKKPQKGEVLGQLDRSSLSSLLNTAEGNGKWQGRQRAKFFDIARLSAFESAACLDALVAKGLTTPSRILDGKKILLRVVSMLKRLVERFDGDEPSNRSKS